LFLVGPQDLTPEALTPNTAVFTIIKFYFCETMRSSSTLELSDASDAHPPIPDNAQDYILLALEVKMDGKLGCAYFSFADSTLALLEETNVVDWTCIELLLTHTRPTVVLVPMRSSEDLLGQLKEFSSSEGLLCCLASYDMVPTS